MLDFFQTIWSLRFHKLGRIGGHGCSSFLVAGGFRYPHNSFFTSYNLGIFKVRAKFSIPGAWMNDFVTFSFDHQREYHLADDLYSKASESFVHLLENRHFH